MTYVIVMTAGLIFHRENVADCFKTDISLT